MIHPITTTGRRRDAPPENDVNRESIGRLPMDRDPSLDDHASSRGHHLGQGPVGGEPACLMHRLCPTCGRVTDEDPPTRCPHCNAVVEGQ